MKVASGMPLDNIAHTFLITSKHQLPLTHTDTWGHPEKAGNGQLEFRSFAATWMSRIRVSNELKSATGGQMPHNPELISQRQKAMTGLT